MARRWVVRVFVLEDSHDRIEEFRKALAGADVSIASSYDEAVALFSPPYDLLCLDHDLGFDETLNPEIENTGYEFVRWLPRASQSFRPKVVVHTHCNVGAAAMARELGLKGFRPAVLPFGRSVLTNVRRMCENARLRETS